MSQSCKQCKFLDVAPDKAGRRTVRAKNAYRCLAPAPELTKVPTSILKCYGFRWPPHRSYVTGADGTDCAAFEKLA